MPWKTIQLDEMSDAIKGFYVFYAPKGENDVADILLQKLSERES
jgi:hypothetical protein